MKLELESSTNVEVALENDQAPSVPGEGETAAEAGAESLGEETLSHYWPHFAVKDAVVASTVTVVVVLLAIFLVPRQVVTDPIYRTAEPTPDWLYIFYLLPYMYLQVVWQLPALLTIPPLAILLLVLVPFVERGSLSWVGRQWRKIVTLSLAVIVVGGLAITTARTGARVPAQGCEACHRPRMVGIPPTNLKSFGHRDSQWIARHVVDPQYWWLR